MTLPERRRRLVPPWPVRVAAVALGLLAFPYVALALAAPHGGSFSGLVFTPSDGYLYLAQIFHGHFGAWTFVDYFTWRRLPPIPIYWLYSLIGHLLVFDPTPVALGLVFHLARLVLAGLMIWQLWRFLGEVTPNRAVRRTAYLLALFASGMGLLQLLLHFSIAGQQPFDLTELESSTFATLLYSPHFALDLLATVVYLRTLPRLLGPGGRWPATALCAGAAATLTSVHPEKIIFVAVTTGLYLGWLTLRREAGVAALSRAALVVGCGSLYPALILVLIQANPLTAILFTQGARTILVQDPLPYYLLGFGLPGIFVLLGLPRLVRRPLTLSPGEALLWSAVIAHLVILAIPMKGLLHRAEGMPLVLAALGARYLIMDILPRLWRSRAFAWVTIRSPLGYSGRRLRELSLNLLLILSIPSTLALTFALPRSAVAQETDIFMTRDDLASFSWIRQHSQFGDVAVGAPETEEFLAAYTGLHSVFGHFSATPDLPQEVRAAALFYQAQAVDPSYLRDRGVRWVYFGPREVSPGGFDPERSSLLTLRYRAGATRVYEVAGS